MNFIEVVKYLKENPGKEAYRKHWEEKTIAVNRTVRYNSKYDYIEYVLVPSKFEPSIDTILADDWEIKKEYPEGYKKNALASVTKSAIYNTKVYVYEVKDGAGFRSFKYFNKPINDVDANKGFTTIRNVTNDDFVFINCDWRYIKTLNMSQQFSAKLEDDYFEQL